jgi:hypothetical protein
MVAVLICPSGLWAAAQPNTSFVLSAPDALQSFWLAFRLGNLMWGIAWVAAASVAFGLGEMNPVGDSIPTDRECRVTFILISVGSAPNVRRRLRGWIESEAKSLGKRSQTPDIADGANGPDDTAILPGDVAQEASAAAGAIPRPRALLWWSHPCNLLVPTPVCSEGGSRVGEEKHRELIVSFVCSA